MPHTSSYMATPIMFSATMTGLWLLVCDQSWRCIDGPGDRVDGACEKSASYYVHVSLQCCIPCSSSSFFSAGFFCVFCGPAISTPHPHHPTPMGKLTGGIFATASFLLSSSLSSCSVMRGGGGCNSSRCGDGSGLAGSGTRVASRTGAGDTEI
jgi:hypothetical protein